MAAAQRVLAAASRWQLVIGSVESVEHDDSVPDEEYGDSEIIGTPGTAEDAVLCGVSRGD